MMGVSEGTFQSERAYAIDGDLTSPWFGARIHPYSLRSVLVKKDGPGAITVFLEALDGDVIYLIDSQTGVTDTYHWPDATEPSKMDLTPPTRFRVRTTGGGAGDKISMLATWAELGAP